MSARALLKPSSAAIRSFAASAVVRGGLKESSTDDPDSLHKNHLSDSLSKQKAGKGHWKPELASDSEEAVKADRRIASAASAAANSAESVARDLKDLQEKTKQMAEETHKSGTSNTDGM